MKGEAVAALVAVALAVGAAAGYLGNTTPARTTTETVVTTETATTTGTVITTYTLTLPPFGSLVCVVTAYTVWMVAFIQNTTTSYGLSTGTYNWQTYTTTTSALESVGFTTVTTSEYSGTITGAVDKGNFTTCTYISG